MIGLAIGVILGVTAITALSTYAATSDEKKKKAGYTPAASAAMFEPIAVGPRAQAVTPEQLTFLKDMIVKMLLRQSISADEKTQAINIAKTAGLAKTAAAIQTGSKLPLDEKWPGTGKSIMDYIKSAIGL